MPADTENQNNSKIEAKYHTVYQDIRSSIEAGTLTGVLSGVREMALKYDVNFMTVDKAIKKLEADGFVYRIPRKGTYVKRQYSVAVCSNDPDKKVLSPPLYHCVIEAAQRYFSEHNCPMYFESLSLNRQNVVDVLHKRIDGFLLFYKEQFPLHEKLLSLPCVRIMGEHEENGLFDHVTYNNLRTGEIAAEYLLDQGCKRVAYIGPYNHRLMSQRRNAFKSCIDAAGGCVYEFPDDNWGFDFDSVLRQMNKILAVKPLPDAIFAPTDSIVADVCNIFFRNNIQPEKDIRIIGCDNLSAYHHPPMVPFASIDLNPEDIGRLGAEQLLKRIENPKLPRYVKILEPKLVLPAQAERQEEKKKKMIEV